jgi:hypothetical protein
MVPNPTKSIVAETQSRLTDIIHELQRNLSRLMWLMKEEDFSGRCGERRREEMGKGEEGVGVGGENGKEVGGEK